MPCLFDSCVDLLGNRDLGLRRQSHAPGGIRSVLTLDMGAGTGLSSTS